MPTFHVTLVGGIGENADSLHREIMQTGNAKRKSELRGIGSAIKRNQRRVKMEVEWRGNRRQCSRIRRGKLDRGVVATFFIISLSVSSGTFFVMEQTLGRYPIACMVTYISVRGNHQISFLHVYSC